MPGATRRLTYLLPELRQEEDPFFLEEPFHRLNVLKGGDVIGGDVAPRAALGFWPRRRHAAQKRMGSHCEPTQACTDARTRTRPPAAHLGA